MPLAVVGTKEGIDMPFSALKLKKGIVLIYIYIYIYLSKPGLELWVV